MTTTKRLSLAMCFATAGALWMAHTGSAQSAEQALVAMQRPDGGWSQMPSTTSDAYATGQALFTLHLAGRMPATDPVYRKGVDYLLKTQAADGTWHVKTRAIWLQPYFESGFPYGRDQFISTAGTAWAAMALAAAAPVTSTCRRRDDGARTAHRGSPSRQRRRPDLSHASPPPPSTRQ